MSEPQGLRERDEDPGNRVRERRLGGKADDQGNDRRRGEDRACDGLHPRDDQKRGKDPDQDHGRHDRAADDAVARHHVRAHLQASDQRPVDQLGHDECGQDDDARDRDVLPELAHERQFSRTAAASCPRSPRRDRARSPRAPRPGASRAAPDRLFRNVGQGSRRAHGRGLSPAHRPSRAPRR
jgi:hypothetical protein